MHALVDIGHRRYVGPTVQTHDVFVNMAKHAKWLSDLKTALHWHQRTKSDDFHYVHWMLVADYPGHVTTYVRRSMSKAQRTPQGS